MAIIAEIGIDMTVFGNAKRLAAWAGVCPGNHESAGKKKSTAARKGNIHLKTTSFRPRSAPPGPRAATTRTSTTG